MASEEGETVRTLLIILATLLVAVPVFALDIGVGVTHYTKSDNTAPFVSLAHQTGSTLAITSWSADEERNDLSVQLALPIMKLEYGLQIQLAGGTGLSWKDWETWEPALNYGVAVTGPAVGFQMRGGWNRVETGGGEEGSNLFFVGVYR